MRAKFTSAQRRAMDEWRLLDLIADMLVMAHSRYAADGNFDARMQLFAAGLRVDEIERLRARVIRRLPSSDRGDVAQLPSILKVGRTMVEECRQRQAARAAAEQKGGAQ